MSVQLAKHGPGLVSDANAALIALYRAVRDGWEPPSAVSKEEYRAAKALPDSDPRKAFIGFGCSFGGKWFGGYAEERWYYYPSSKQSKYRNHTAESGRSLARDIPALSACRIERKSFFDVTPSDNSFQPECIYADPPYAGTTGYAATGVFDNERFWHYCQQWASRGVRVFVSEYACPVPHEVAWEKRHTVNVSGGTGAVRTERLLRVLPA